MEEAEEEISVFDTEIVVDGLVTSNLVADDTSSLTCENVSLPASPAHLQCQKLQCLLCQSMIVTGVILMQSTESTCVSVNVLVESIRLKCSQYFSTQTIFAHILE